jgi:hypothetical protein
VFGLASSDLGFDPAFSDEPAVLFVVVATVGRHPVGATARPPDATAYRRYRVDKRDQLGDVVAVATGERPGERDPGRVDQEMVLRPVSGSINRARARFGAPLPRLHMARVRNRARPLDLASSS